MYSLIERMDYGIPFSHELFLWKIFSKRKGNMGVITQPASEAPWGVILILLVTLVCLLSI